MTEVEEMSRDESAWAELPKTRKRRGERFRAHVERLMEERGIETLEELHSRFVETEYADVPVPGRHRGKPVSLEVFKRLTAGEGRYFYAELLCGLCEVLELTEEESSDLAFVYIWGEQSSATTHQA